MESTEETLFQKALMDFISDNYEKSIETLNELIEKYSTSKSLSSYILYRAKSKNEGEKYEEALKDIETLEKNSSYEKGFNFYITKGIINYNLSKFVESKMNFTSALQSISANDLEHRNKLIPWMNKVDIELKESGIIDFNKINKGELKMIYNWIQTGDYITVDITSNHNINEYDIKINVKSIEFISKLSNEVKYIINLTNNIIPDKSKYNITSSMKIKLELKKEVENFNWVNLENKYETIDPINNQKDKIGYYPTSSKVKKDWSQIDKEYDKEEKEDATKDSNEGMWKLFRDIYERGDEKTRRAMIKSFQTSSGTVLSTNWDDVKDKDYEGKDRPEAPKGQEWAK
jgi:suppressor of G2 allele of SKP1